MLSLCRHEFHLAQKCLCLFCVKRSNIPFLSTFSICADVLSLDRLKWTQNCHSWMDEGTIHWNADTQWLSVQAAKCFTHRMPAHQHARTCWHMRVYRLTDRNFFFYPLHPKQIGVHGYFTSLPVSLILAASSLISFSHHPVHAICRNK